MPVIVDGLMVHGDSLSHAISMIIVKDSIADIRLLYSAMRKNARSLAFCFTGVMQCKVPYLKHALYPKMVKDLTYLSKQII